MNDENIIAIHRKDIVLANEAFSALMRKTESAMNEKAKQHLELRKASASDLEKISCETIKEVCVDTPFNPNEIKLISGAKFPDIVAEQFYGVEVKSTIKDHWCSTGSSILETTRVKSVENIYMLFGKLGGSPAEFKCRPYQDVLYEIAVTHSPRYLIDMNLAKGESIFDKMGTTYDKLRTSNDSIGEVKSYYANKAKSEGKTAMPWWLGGGGSEDDTSPMNLHFWKDVETQDKKELVAKLFLLFPEVICSQYKRAVLWLCATYGIINSNMRDSFSAGGQVKKINGLKLKKPLPQSYKRLIDSAPAIKALANDETFLSTHIKDQNPALLVLDGDPITIWLQQVAELTNNRFKPDWFINNDNYEMS